MIPLALSNIKSKVSANNFSSKLNFVEWQEKGPVLESYWKNKGDMVSIELFKAIQEKSLALAITSLKDTKRTKI